MRFLTRASAAPRARFVVLATLVLAGCDSAAALEGYFACANKSCGDDCRACDPNDPNCVETAVPKACTTTGLCVPRPVTCRTTPCSNKRCGEECNPCGTSDPICVGTTVFYGCNLAGVCA